VNWPAITSLVTALTAIGALIFTALSLNATRDQVVVAQSQNTVAEQGQLTDRYTKAVEQLGQPNADRLQVRLGGIYALERLARDSPRDLPTIIEILSAFVRTNTAPPAAPRTPTTPVSCSRRHITADVQAGLTVLGRRDPSHDQRAVVDLHDTCLVGAVFDGANFAEADFGNANLTDAVFFTANLDDAIFFAADFTNVRFYVRDGGWGATCSGTDFRYANLPKFGDGCYTLDDADLYGANLAGATLVGAHAQGAHLDGANLAGATLWTVDFRGASFHKANLTGADLRRADLSGADLQGTQHGNTNVDDVRTNSDTKGMWW
jgi:hypothetical protein